MRGGMRVGRFIVTRTSLIAIGNLVVRAIRAPQVSDARQVRTTHTS